MTTPTPASLPWSPCELSLVLTSPTVFQEFCAPVFPYTAFSSGFGYPQHTRSVVLLCSRSPHRFFLGRRCCYRWPLCCCICRHWWERKESGVRIREERRIGVQGQLTCVYTKNTIFLITYQYSIQILKQNRWADGVPGVFLKLLPQNVVLLEKICKTWGFPLSFTFF